VQHAELIQQLLFLLQQGSILLALLCLERVEQLSEAADACCELLDERWCGWLLLLSLLHLHV
jgi:hypothetical protein